MRYDINLSPDEPVLHGRHLSVIADRWIDDCRGRLSPVTVEGYYFKIQFFLDWWGIEGPALCWELRQTDMHRFNRYLSTVENPRPPGQLIGFNTRRDALRRLRAMLHWAHRVGYTGPLNCALWVPLTPEGSAPLHLPLSIAVMRMTFDAAGQMPFAARNQALLATFIGTGARFAEVTGLDIEDLTFHAGGSGILRIRNAKRVKGRNIHQRLACFDGHTGAYLLRWLDLRGTSSGALWVDENGGRLSGQGIRRAVKAAADAAGVSTGGLHGFRRTFVTYFAQQRSGEGNYHLLQLQVGHAPQGTTRRYYDLRSIDDLADIFVSPMQEVAPAGRTMAMMPAFMVAGGES